MSAKLNEKQQDVKTMKPKSRGLGRGLDALFGDEEESYSSPSTPEKEISNNSRKTVGIDKLFPCPTQPRQHFEEDALKTLAASIAEHGLLQPILVRPDASRDGYYEIVAGERRWRASQKAQLHEVPVVIREMDDEAMFQIALVENLQRQDLSAIEEARGYKRLVEEFDHSHEEIGKVLGRSRSHIANMIRLLDLPDAIQMMVDVGDITAGHARALIGQKDSFQMALDIIEKKLSVRDTEKMVAAAQGRNIKSRGNVGQKGFAKKEADTLALEKEVSDQIGMNVSIDMKDAHKGKMTIQFKNLDQLDDILQRLAQTPKKHSFD